LAFGHSVGEVLRSTEVLYKLSTTFRNFIFGPQNLNMTLSPIIDGNMSIFIANPCIHECKVKSLDSWGLSGSPY
jgi:hypothetical protein